MKYIILIGLMASMSTFATTCSFDSGKAKVTYLSRTIANVKISANIGSPLYKGCKVSSDEFGKLIDCSTGNRDFMLLISKNRSGTNGGIMSKTLDLFEDLSC